MTGKATRVAFFVVLDRVAGLPDLGVMKTVDPALQFLLEALRGEPLSEDRARSPESWSALLGLAEMHRVTPALQRALGSAALPDFVAVTLQTRARANAVRSLSLVHELAQAVRFLSDAGIPAISLKGPLLSWRLYGSLALRVCSDLDLLVRRVDVVTAIEALTAAGYQTSLTLRGALGRAYLRDYHDLALCTPAGELLELHWSWAQRRFAFPDQPAAWWAESRVVAGPWGAVRTLAPHHELLFLSVHAAKHAWGQLDLLCDVAALIRTCGIDWNRVQAAACALGIERILQVTLSLARRVDASLPLPTPSSQHERAEKLADQVTETWRWSTPRSSVRRLGFDLGTRERLRDRLRIITRTAFTPSPEDWAAVKLPGHWFGLYRVVRLLRLSGVWPRQRGKILEQPVGHQA